MDTLGVTSRKILEELEVVSYVLAVNTMGYYIGLFFFTEAHFILFPYLKVDWEVHLVNISNIILYF